MSPKMPETPMVWPEDVDPATGQMTGPPLDGAKVLDQVEAFVSRFVKYPDEFSRTAHVLWIAHTWRMNLWDSTPRLAFMSAEPGSGKTRALEITAELVPEPLHAVSATPAYLLRKIADEDGAPTVLQDEIDALFGPKARGEGTEEIRALYNAGHRRGAVSGRCEKQGGKIVPVDMPAYSALALAGLSMSNLPDTIRTRSVAIQMKRRAAGEKVEAWRARTGKAEAALVREALKQWMNSMPDSITDWPDMPDGVEDRDADVWEALLWIAQQAGGSWPDRTRAAAVHFVELSKDMPATIGVLLLSDLRKVFDARPEALHLATQDLLEALRNMDESPWGDEERLLGSRELAKMLKEYDVRSRKVRIGARTVQGYRREDLTDPWSRYLTPLAQQAEHPEHPEHPHDKAENSCSTRDGQVEQAEHAGATPLMKEGR